MLKHLCNKFKTFWFSFGELKEPEDYFYLKDGVFIPFGKVKPDVELTECSRSELAVLTHREVQQLRSLLKQEIMFTEAEVNFARRGRDYHWNRSSKDDPSTKAFFFKLNICKGRLTQAKADLKKLVNLQTKLKRLKGL